MFTLRLHARGPQRPQEGRRLAPCLQGLRQVLRHHVERHRAGPRKDSSAWEKCAGCMMLRGDSIGKTAEI